MTRAKFLALVGTGGGTFKTLDGYKQALSYYGYTVWFGIAKPNAKTWYTYELTTGLSCCCGSTRINALDETRRRMREIALLCQRGDSDPESTIAKARARLNAYQKQTAEDALQ